jgi:hypothetical protein
MIVPALFPHAVERPNRSHPSIRAKAIDQMTKDVMAYLRNQGHDDENEEDIARQLREAFWVREDGYHAAKELDEQFHWSPDAELVEVLDSFGHYMYLAHDDAIKAWVKEYDIKAPLAVGTLVEAEWGGETIRGKIIDVRAETAQYTVQRPEDTAKGGAIVNFEDTREAP